MKKLFLSLVLITASFTAFAQDFDVFVRDMNSYSRPYQNDQVVDLYYNYYGVPQATLHAYYSDFGNNWGNVVLALEFSRILRIPMPELHVIYRDGYSQGEGWGVMAKRYGIKPGLAEFHRMKRDLNRAKRSWYRIYGDYGKQKNPRIAKRGIYIYDDGMVKIKGKKDKRYKAYEKAAKKQQKEFNKQMKKRNKSKKHW